MKILHKSKKSSAPHPHVSEFINTLISTDDAQLPDVLKNVRSWKWLRSDLNAWVKVLNKFDAILERVIRDYNIDQVQTQTFTPLVKTTVCEILRFERLLLENSTNRKLFSSYDRLNSLLSTSDIDVLVLALHLLLRPAQQYSGQPAVSHALGISTSHLQSIAKRWPSLRNHSISLLELVSPNTQDIVTALPAEARTVNFTFYPAHEKKDKSARTPAETTPAVINEANDLASPAKTQTTSAPSATSAVTVTIPEDKLISSSPTNVLSDTMSDVKGLSDDDKFDLLCRIRSARALTSAFPSEREKLVTARLLAIAIFGHTHPESQAVTSLFLYEPDLITHVAEILRLDGNVSVPIQSAAIAALDAISRYRTKVQDVLTAINAGVNHGILMALLRRTIGDISKPDCSLPHSFVDALMSFVTYISSHQSGVNMIVGAGLIPLLVQLIENKLPERLPVLSKTMQLLDNILYSFNNAFQLFVGARGVDALVERIQHEIDLDLKEFGDNDRARELLNGELPVARSATLKHTLRSMHRMMTSSGSSEGLRGLIDSSLLSSIKKIIEFRGLFGPNVIPIAMSIMATFVHNEPTSLTIIQESGLPETFYNAIEQGLEPVIEVIQAIPNAIGALCLNQTGIDQLASRPSIIPCIFSIFTSEKHLKVLQEKENAAVIGTAMDELIRHHPFLKTGVFQSVISTLSKIEDLGQEYEPSEKIRHWYKLAVTTTASSDDVVMESPEIADKPTADVAMSVQELAPPPLFAEATPQVAAANAEGEGFTAHDNSIISFMDVTGRFLEGLFQHPPHCKDFLSSTDGLERICRLTTLPCLPYDFAQSVAVDSLVQVIRTMTEISPNDTIVYLTKIVDQSMKETKDFWSDMGEESKLSPLLEISESDAAKQQQFRKLTTLYIRVSILSDVFSTVGYTHGRAAISLLQTLMSSATSSIVSSLGNLHRVCSWQNTLFKAGLPNKESPAPVPSQPIDNESDSSLAPTLPIEVPVPAVITPTDTVMDDLATPGSVTPAPVAEMSPAPPTIAAVSGPLSRESAQEQNTKALKSLLNGMSDSLAPFFQATIRLFSARRNPDGSQKQQIVDASSVVAKVMMQHLSFNIYENDSKNRLSILAYHTLMLGIASLYLIDADRASQQTHHTVLLASFVRVGGLDAILTICKSFMDGIATIHSIKDTDRTELQCQEYIHCHGGLKLAMNIIQPLIYSRCLHESSQTSLLVTRDKAETDKDFFEPHNFLVRLRLAVCPIVTEIWEAPWLSSSTESLIKSVVQSVLELTSGDREESRAENLVDAGAPGFLHRNTGPDENAITQLTDMGFPRAAAEQALRRTRNNVNAATELLLSNPFVLVEAQAQALAQEEGGDDMDEDGDDDDTPAPAQVSISGEQPSDSMLDESISNVPLAPEPEVKQRTVEEWRAELNSARAKLKEEMPIVSLRLVDEHPQLIFDIYPVFTRPSTDNTQDQTVRFLVSDIKKFSPDAYDDKEKPMAVRCRLLALVFTESPSSISKSTQTDLMNSLLALLLAHPSSANGDHPATPHWLAGHLLVTESLLTMSTQPASIELPKEGDAIPSVSLSTGPQYEEAKQTIFDFCMRLLHDIDLPRDEFLAALRLLVLLTRVYTFAQSFVAKDGIGLLFRRFSTSPVPDSQSYIALILRHVVEDKAILTKIMTQEIKRLISNPRTAVIDASNFVRHCQAIAARDPAVFIEATQAACKLESPWAASYTLQARSSATKDTPEDQRSAIVPPAVAATPVSESLESVVYFFITELTKTVKPQGDVSPVDIKATDPESGPQLYALFLMQGLTEMLFSYDASKVAFLSYSPKKKSLQTPSKDSTKHRMAVLNFFFNELIWFGPLDTLSEASSRDRNALCTCAISVITALSVDTASGIDSKEPSADLVSVRKFVLEALSKTIKELASVESQQIRFGKLFALAELTYRLLVVRIGGSSRKKEEENPTHIAKLMLEKGFVATLTAALADVDPNYPNVKVLVIAILRPLEVLTKLAIRMSKSSDKGKEIEVVDDGPISSDSEEDEDIEADDANREETPDLYRNSALGIFGGEMEDVRFTQDADARGDGDDEEDDAEMEYTEETASDDTSNTDEEDIDEQPDGGWVDEEGDFGGDDLAQGEDDDEAEDEEEDEDDDDEDEDDEDEDDEDGDEEANPTTAEMVWNEITGQDIGIEHQIDPVRDMAAVHIPVEPDMHSDDEDYATDLAALEETHPPLPGGHQIFDLPGDMPGLPDMLDNTQIFVNRRHRHVGDEPVFGRSRNQAGPPMEAVTHPLLLDGSSTANNTFATNIRSQRRSRAVMGGLGGAHADLLQTIEELISGGAYQLVHHVPVRGRVPGGPEVFAAVAMQSANDLGHNIIQRAAAAAAAAAGFSAHPPGHSHRSERSSDSRTFDPQLTLQRWSEESKILHGRHVTERMSKLVNHLIIALLPEAIEAEKTAKAAKEEEEKKLRDEEEKRKSEEEAAAASQEATAPAVVEIEPQTVVPEATTTEDASHDQPEQSVSETPEAPASNPSIVDEEMKIDVDVAAPAAEATPTAEEVAAPAVTDQAPEASTSEPTAGSAARVVVTVHGNEVDITDTGIDPTFLEALPDEIREEVINQHLREQRASRVQRPPESEISNEFLDALPPEIRAEILQQERFERSRQRDAPETAAADGTVTAAEIDPASFIASLDPQLRSDVLMESDERFLQSLPAFMLAEAGAFRDTQRVNRHQIRTATPRTTATPRKAAVNRDAIQLLDKSGIAVLVRLLFFPQVLKKNHLSRVLLNLCENAKSRVELFNLLLSILHNGSGDLTSVDKSFAQMSVKPLTGTINKELSAKAAGKQKAGSESAGTSLPLTGIQNEALPDLIAQRCLEALTYIVTSNESSSLFFLTEHELPTGLRPAPSKKGKAKERQQPMVHYPIVLMLGLLDRKSLLKTTSLMEAIVGLLAMVTRPLGNLASPTNPELDKEQKGSTSDAPVAAPEAVADETSAASSQAPNDQGSGAPQGTSIPPVPTSDANAASTSEQRLSTDSAVQLASAPVIPQNALRYIVNILTVGECSAKTFQQSLALISHLSHIPDARDVIAQELRSKAQECGSSLLGDLDNLAASLSDSEGDILSGNVAPKFSSASSDQAKLLRVLKTIDYMFSSPKAAPSNDVSNEEKVQGIYQAFNFSSLWTKLGDCLAVVEQKPSTEHIATVLLPLIEALMVVCKHVGSKEGTKISRVPSTPVVGTEPKESIDELFVSFTDTHRKVLNLMVRNNPSLMSGSFSLLVNNPRVLDFDNKRNYFNQQLHRRPHPREHGGTLQVSVRRERVFESSFQSLQRKTGDQIKYGKLSVLFYDEEGVDAGGVTREWFQILARQMFDPNYALFQPCAADKLTYQPNKNSGIHTDHLAFFQFVGRIIGKAIYDGRLLDAYFARSLYRQLLGKQVDYRDVEWVDPEYYKSLCWILENDPEPLELTFSVEADVFGESTIAPLKENGASIPVTNENKREFVQLSATYRLYSSIQKQIEKLLFGFYEIIPKELIQIFNEQELELLISGTPDIDVDEWRAATEYNGYTSSEPVIVWFWRALKSFNRDERAKVLSFATGTSRVPLDGFVDLQGVQGVQRFSIHRAYGDTNRLPQAHTCFNQIDLPQYTSYEMLRQQLLLAINEGGEGFGFA